MFSRNRMMALACLPVLLLASLLLDSRTESAAFASRMAGQETIVGKKKPPRPPPACHSTRRPEVKSRKGTGTACTQAEALQKALDSLGDSECTGDKNPGCIGTCTADRACQKTTTKRAGKVSYKPAKVPVDNCQGGGWDATVEGDFYCGCRCR